ncbi:hypothetical protein [Zavarzinella formosa]|uniref:hypothetical protein n=1 Tax=Zavarzinella formosa TaxID=360055 RepID=UPI0002DD69B6|nr:hypothetical protein [Zavarzinella formosa]
MKNPTGRRASLWDQGDIPRQEIDEPKEDDLGSEPAQDGCGLVSSRHPLAGLMLLSDDGWHGISYASILGEVRMDRNGSRIEFRYESDKGVFDVTIDGSNLYQVARHLVQCKRDELRVGEPASGVGNVVRIGVTPAAVEEE